MRKISLISTMLPLLFAATPSWAHGSMQGTIPADGAVLENSPSIIAFNFEEPVKITRVQIARVEENSEIDGEEQSEDMEEMDMEEMEVQLVSEALQEVNGEPVDLEIGEQNAFDTTFEFAIDTLSEGVYELTLRGLGQDGHAMVQSSRFEVQ